MKEQIEAILKDFCEPVRGVTTNIGFKITLVQALAIDFIYAMLSFKAEGKSYTTKQRFENFAIHVIMALYTWGLVYSIYVVTN